jgi:hypothetical protein
MTVDTVELGRDAIDRHAWAEAVEAFDAADTHSALAPADLELLGAARWWSGHPAEAADALEPGSRSSSHIRRSGVAWSPSAADG